jgi:putative Mn2+ efflux pump MntP
VPPRYLRDLNEYPANVKKRIRVVLTLVLSSTPALLGAVLGWIVSAGAPPGVRAAAPWIGATIGFAIALILSVVSRAFARPRPVEDSDWRERSRRMEERAHQNFAWMARWAWALALPPALIGAALLLAAGGSMSQALVVGPITFIAVWVAVRLASVAGPKMLFLPKGRPPSSPRDSSE